MIICEALLLTILAALLVSSSYTDCKESIVRNNTLAKCGIGALIVDLIYYAIFATEYLGLAFINWFIITIVSIVFYSYHLWAAGDSKLLIIIGLCIPGRFYSFWDIGRCSGFTIIIFTFSLAFIYIIVESFVLGIKNKDLFEMSFQRPRYIEGIISYFSMVGSIIVIGLMLPYILGSLYYDDSAFYIAMNFLIVLTLIHIRNKVNFIVLRYYTVATWILISVLVSMGVMEFANTLDIKSWGMVLCIMALRVIAEKYNYKTIPTKEVRKGHILSVATIIGFKSSRVKGLPTGMTEDLRSRITEEEANSIHRWESSTFGKPTVMIVRKIPFAAFISVGTMVFLGIEVIMLWH